MRSRRLLLTVVLVPLLAIPATAQWLNYPTPGTPRLADGSANLAAPAPRTPDGRPDLTGVWSGAGPMYRFNIAQDLGPGDVKPWAEALFLQRLRDSRKDSPLARCLPVSVPYHNFFNLTQFVQTPAHAGDALRIAEQPASHDLHGRPAASGRSESRLARLLDRPLGRRHAGDHDGGLQRSRVARQRRPPADRITAAHRTHPPPRLRAHGVRDDDRRSGGVHEAVHDQDRARARAGHRPARGRLREREGSAPLLAGGRRPRESGDPRPATPAPTSWRPGATRWWSSRAICSSCKGSTSRSCRCWRSRTRSSCRPRRRPASSSSRTRQGRVTHLMVRGANGDRRATPKAAPSAR